MGKGRKEGRKKIVVRVERTNTGFSAWTEKYPAFTTGRSAAELIANMVEALNLHFEEEGSKTKVTNRDPTFRVELSSVFEVFQLMWEFYLRGLE